MSYICSKILVRPTSSFSLSKIGLFFVLSLFLSAHTNAATKTKAPAAEINALNAEACIALLAPVEGVPQEATQRPGKLPLLSLLSSDPKQNLAALNPLTVMNEGARVLSVIKYKKPTSVIDPELGGRVVNLYPMLSIRSPENGYRSIDGHLETLEAFVEWVDASARGDGAGKRTFQTVGPSGSGKSELAEVANSLLGNLGKFDSRFKDWTFRLINLKEVLEGVEKEILDDTYTVPFYQTPLVLLPPSLQRAVLTSPAVVAAARDLSGHDPNPDLRRNPQVEWLRSKIIDYYQRLAGGRPLTDIEIAQAVAKHTEIVPWVQGESNFSSKIDAQGRDVDWGGLFFTPNPLVQALWGPGHPMAYHLNGALLRLNGGSGTLDEWYRNHASLRDTFLGVQEERTVQRGGSPKVPLNALLIGATNDESLEAAENDGGTNAQIDRAQAHSMRWSTHPWLLMKTILAMKSLKNVQQKKLNTTAQPEASVEVVQDYKPADLEELFVYGRKIGEPMLGPEGRYTIRLKTGADSFVYVSPHALELMAFTISASRQVNDPEAALKIRKANPPQVIHESEFKDPVARIKVMLGLNEIQQARAIELHELSIELREGSAGITQRNAADVWLQAAIAEARRPESHNTITPEIILNVFREKVRSGGIRSTSPAQKQRWYSLIGKMAESFTIPSIRKDVLAAIGAAEGNLDEVYTAVRSELEALDVNPDANSYSAASGETRRIDRDRLKEIKEIYYRTNQRDFKVSELLRLRTYGVDGETVRHQLLLAAIEEYFAKYAMKTFPISSLASASRTGDGTTGTKTKLSEFFLIMEQRFGYNEAAARAALNIVDKTMMAQQARTQP